jgi:hypothetical protein
VRRATAGRGVSAQADTSSSRYSFIEGRYLAELTKGTLESQILCEKRFLLTC